jgi:excinuclease UvrABC nuclease subunit
VRHIRWQPTHSVFEATFEYYRIARLVMPDTYLKNVAFAPAWFVHVDPAASIPRLTVSKPVLSPPGTTLGPFATQADANRFVQILEDAFDLCRYFHILEQAPHGQPCAYFEMGRCPAPCNASIPMSQYREMMASALRFASGQRDEIRSVWEQQMRQAAAGLEFEKAAAIKQRLDRAKDLDHAAFRLVRPIERFSWLILQRGGGRTRIKPFFVRGGWLQPGDVVKVKELESAVPRWMEALRETGDGPPQELSEHIWLVSHFLFRREQMGMFLDATGLPTAEELTEAIRQHFSATKAEVCDPSGEELSAGAEVDSRGCEPSVGGPKSQKP